MKNLLEKRQSIKYSGGQIVILNTILFLAISLLLIAGIAYPVISHYSEMQSLIQSKQSFLATQSAMDEGLYRLKNGLAISLSSPTTINLASSSATITITDLPTGKGKRILVNGTANGYQRNAQMDLSFGGTGISFHYGIQSGRGGFSMSNNSSIYGNVFSNGTVTGSNGAIIHGDVISAGSTGVVDGLINDITATGTVYAHKIQNSTIGKDAYYATISGSTVGGMSSTTSNDKLAATMPVSDADITQWKADATGGGEANTTACPDQNSTYTVDSDIIGPIGPLKIPCNLTLSGNVTIRGTLWVTGAITTSNGSIVCLAPSYGSNGGIIVADGTINVSNNVQFQANPPCTTSGYILLLSTNNGDDAIVLSNNVTSVIINAQKGTIHVNNNASAKELTANKITMEPNSSVTYETGLANSNFSSGPGGGYVQTGWSEI